MNNITLLRFFLQFLMQFLSFMFAVLLSVTVHFIALRLGRAIMHQSIGCESIFQDGGHPPSLICLGHIWTTHREYLGSLSLQNMVMVNAVVLIIWRFQYLAYLGGKCLFMPSKLGFWGYLISWMGSSINQSQKRYTLAWVSVIWAIKHENVVSCLNE